TNVLTQIGALEQLETGLFPAKLRESPFYPAGGGQVSDTGLIELDGGDATAELREAYRFGDDQALLLAGDGFAVGDRVRATVAWSVRFPTQANHTATHLLQKALQTVLGDHVKQAGSAVRPEKLRFDFTHQHPLAAEERERVERMVNEQIVAASPVRIYETPIEEARKLGAMMLFGEKYGEIVRVVEVSGYSSELCGGTHVRTTAEIGPFAILSESSVGSGVRRIEAVTSGEALALLQGRAREADELRAEVEALKRDARKQPAQTAAGPEFASYESAPTSGINVVIGRLESFALDALVDLSDQVREREQPAAVVLASQEDGRVHLVVNLDRSLEQRGLDAVRVVREAAALVGGGGGGRPTLARAGGKDASKLPEALDTARRLIVETLA
ncbi:MAG: DHHA1 domain-containing protein, partial [Gaiellaceae bacterium]